MKAYNTIQINAPVDGEHLLQTLSEALKRFPVVEVRALENGIEFQCLDSETLNNIKDKAFMFIPAATFDLSAAVHWYDNSPHKDKHKRHIIRLTGSYGHVDVVSIRKYYAGLREMGLDPAKFFVEDGYV